MKKKNVTIFIEVKMASESSFSLPERMFTSSKIKKLLKAISLYTVKYRIKDYRLDLVAISYDKDKGRLNHYKDVLSFL
jgi:Holliday junction resolvase-like predicted endonuclease